MRVTLAAERGVVLEATFETYQCPGCVACGKAVCELATGKSLAEAGAVRHQDLVALVGPLPRHRQICYGLALLALGSALNLISGTDGRHAPRADGAQSFGVEEGAASGGPSAGIRASTSGGTGPKPSQSQ